MGALKQFQDAVNAAALRSEQLRQSSGDAVANQASMKAATDLNQLKLKLFTGHVLPRLQAAKANKATIDAALYQWETKTVQMLGNAGFMPTIKELEDSKGAGSASMQGRRRQYADDLELSRLNQQGLAGQAAIKARALQRAVNAPGELLDAGLSRVDSAFAGAANDGLNFVRRLANPDRTAEQDKQTSLGRAARRMAEESRQKAERGGAGSVQSDNTVLGDLWRNTHDVSTSLLQSTPGMVIGMGVGGGTSLGLRALGAGRGTQMVGGMLAGAATEFPQNYDDAKTSSIATLNERDQTGKRLITNADMAEYVPLFRKVRDAEIEKGTDPQQADEIAREATVERLSQKAALQGASVAQLISLIGPGAGGYAAKRLASRQGASASSARIARLTRLLGLDDIPLTAQRASQATRRSTYAGIGLGTETSRAVKREALEEPGQEFSMNVARENARATASGEDFNWGNTTQNLASSTITGGIMGGASRMATHGTQQQADRRQIRDMASQTRAMEASMAQNQAGIQAIQQRAAAAGGQLLPAQQDELQARTDALQQAQQAYQAHVANMQQLGLNPYGGVLSAGTPAAQGQAGSPAAPAATPAPAQQPAPAAPAATLPQGTPPAPQQPPATAPAATAQAPAPVPAPAPAQQPGQPAPAATAPAQQGPKPPRWNVMGLNNLGGETVLMVDDGGVITHRPVSDLDSMEQEGLTFSSPDVEQQVNALRQGGVASPQAQQSGQPSAQPQPDPQQQPAPQQNQADQFPDFVNAELARNGFNPSAPAPAVTPPAPPKPGLAGVAERAANRASQSGNEATRIIQDAIARGMTTQDAISHANSVLNPQEPTQQQPKPPRWNVLGVTDLNGTPVVMVDDGGLMVHRSVSDLDAMQKEGMTFSSPDVEQQVNALRQGIAPAAPAPAPAPDQQTVASPAPAPAPATAAEQAPAKPKKPRQPKAQKPADAAPAQPEQIAEPSAPAEAVQPADAMWNAIDSLDMSHVEPYKDTNPKLYRQAQRAIEERKRKLQYQQDKDKVDAEVQDAVIAATKPLYDERERLIAEIKRIDKADGLLKKVYEHVFEQALNGTPVSQEDALKKFAPPKLLENRERIKSLSDKIDKLASKAAERAKAKIAARDKSRQPTQQAKPEPAKPAPVQAPSAAAPGIQQGDITRSDGQPFANRNAANLQMGKRGLKNTHEVVELAPSQFVVRPRQQQAEANPAEQSQQTAPQAPKDTHGAWATRNGELGDAYRRVKDELNPLINQLRDATREDSVALPDGYQTIPYTERGKDTGMVVLRDEYGNDIAYPLTPSEASEQAWRESGNPEGRYAKSRALKAKLQPKIDELTKKLDKAGEAWDSNGESPNAPKWERERQAQLAAEQAQRERIAKSAQTRRKKAEAKQDAKPEVSTDQSAKQQQGTQPRTLDEDGRPTDGKPIYPGDVFTTLSGRVTTPSPKQKNERYHSQWLIDNAIAEAEARGDDYNATMFRATKPLRNGELASSDRDSMLMYLFTHQPPVVRSILRDINEPSPVPSADPAAAQPSEQQDQPKAAEQVKPEAQQATPESAAPDPFANNTLFTSDKVAAARERLKKKLSGNQLNSGIDPELLMDGMVVAGAYIESGVRNFTQYAARMVADLGDNVKPYLLSFWEGARHFPGLDTTGMSSIEESQAEHERINAGPVSEAVANEVDAKQDADAIIHIEQGKAEPDSASEVSNSMQTAVRNLNDPDYRAMLKQLEDDVNRAIAEAPANPIAIGVNIRRTGGMRHQQVFVFPASMTRGNVTAQEIEQEFFRQVEQEIGLKPSKADIVTAAHKIVEALNGRPPRLIFDVKGDGKFNVRNDKQSLTKFLKQIKESGGFSKPRAARSTGPQERKSGGMSATEKLGVLKTAVSEGLDSPSDAEIEANAYQLADAMGLPILYSLSTPAGKDGRSNRVTASAVINQFEWAGRNINVGFVLNKVDGKSETHQYLLLLDDGEIVNTGKTTKEIIDQLKKDIWENDSQKLDMALQRRVGRHGPLASQEELKQKFFQQFKERTGIDLNDDGSDTAAPMEDRQDSPSNVDGQMAESNKDQPAPTQQPMAAPVDPITENRLKNLRQQLNKRNLGIGQRRLIEGKIAKLEAVRAKQQPASTQQSTPENSDNDPYAYAFRSPQSGKPVLVPNKATADAIANSKQLKNRAMPRKLTAAEIRSGDFHMIGFEKGDPLKMGYVIDVDAVNRPVDKAAKLRKESERLAKEAHKMLDRIEPGQPVLSTRDRNLRERSMEKMRKAAELDAQADALEGAKPLSPEAMRERLQEASSDELKAVFDMLGLAGSLLTHRELVNALLAEDAQEVSDALDRAVADRKNPSPAPTKESAAPAQKPVAKSPASKTPLMDRHNQRMERLKDGTATLDEYRQGYADLLANKDAILAELNGKTKKELSDIAGPRYISEKKDVVVKAAFEKMQRDYSIGRSITYTLGVRGDGLSSSLARMVERTTEQDLKSFADKVAEHRKQAEARRQELNQSVADPQTYEQVVQKLRVELGTGKAESFEDAYMALTPEQRAMYDRGQSAQQDRAAAAKLAQERPKTAQYSGPTTTATIQQTKHTKHGHDLWVVTLADRLDRADYDKANADAKKLGGSYSSYRGGGAIPGFQFRTPEAAQAFADLMGGNRQAADQQMQEKQDALLDDKNQSGIERLNAIADRLQEKADDVLQADRKVNTARRARMAGYATAHGRKLEARAKTVRALIAQIESGEASPYLSRIRANTQLEFLDNLVAQALQDHLRKSPKDFPGKAMIEAEAVPDTASYADLPKYQMDVSEWGALANRLDDRDGTAKLVKQIRDIADSGVSDDYLKFAKENLGRVLLSKSGGEGAAIFQGSRDGLEKSLRRHPERDKVMLLQIKRGEYAVVLSPKAAKERGVWDGNPGKRVAVNATFGGSVVEKLQSLGLEVPHALSYANERMQQLQRLGIDTPAKLRDTLREYIKLKAPVQEEDTVSRLQRELSAQGRQNDGLDFFPTAPAVIDQMIEAADLQPGQRVLEPSAGMGHIADRVRSEGIEPEVIEFSPKRRELLEAKGFNVQGSDFMEFTDANHDTRGFTYGDVFRAPDGTLGILRGSGGMGSNRVSLDPLDENGNPDTRRGQWHNFDDLEPVERRGIGSGYDRILMNPPFGNRRDAQHVQHAYDLLRPGGRIVAIMGEGVFFGQDAKAKAFRDWLDSVGGTSEQLPEGSFQDPSLPVTTGVNARLVVIDKAADGAADSGIRYSRRASGDSAAEAQPARKPTGLTTAKVRDILIKKIGKPALEALEKAGRLEVIQTFDPTKSAGDLMRSVMAWHGSPFKFDRFSLEHLGRGEGNQAFGWGLYFADSRGVSEWYRKELTTPAGKVFFNGKWYAFGHSDVEESEQLAKDLSEWYGFSRRVVTRAIMAMRAHGGVADAFANFSKDHPASERKGSQELQDTFSLLSILDDKTRNADDGRGQLYRVQIPADDTYLLWDKPLSEQSEKVQKALQDKRAAAALAKHRQQNKSLFAYLGESAFAGDEIYAALKVALGSDKAASQYLHNLGVSGIKYLDGTSRDAGEGSHNYVVFDDNAVQILETYYSRVDDQPEGFYDPSTGKATLVADALTEATVIPTLLHELSGHHGFQKLMKPETYQAILAQVKRLAERGNPIAKAAMDRAAVEQDAQAREDELLPYLITVAQLHHQSRSPAMQAVQRLIDQTIRAIKTWAAERGFGPAIRNLSADDIRVLSEKMLKREASRPDPQGPKRSKASQQFSQIDSPRSELAAVRRQHEGKPTWMKAPNGQPTKLTERQWLQVRTPRFKKWFGDWENDPANASKVVDENGEPKLMYRGDPTSWTVWDDTRGGGLIHMGDSQAVAEYYAHGRGGGRRHKSDPVYTNLRTGEQYQIGPSGHSYVNLATNEHIPTDEFDRIQRRLNDMGELKIEYPGAEVKTLFANLRSPLDLRRLGRADGHREASKVLTDLLPILERRAQRSPSEPLREAITLLQNMNTNEVGFGWGSTKHEFAFKAWRDVLVPLLKRRGYDGLMFGDDSHYTWTVFDGEQIKSATDNAGTFSPTNPNIRYSRPTPSNHPLPPNYTMARYVARAFGRGTSQSIGTMLHNALQNPEFRKVFDLQQAKLNQVNADAFDSIDAAPGLLDRLENFEDVKRMTRQLVPEIGSRTTANGRDVPTLQMRDMADIKAAAEAIFDGTLMHKTVFTDAELRSIFGLTDKQIGFYRSARKAIDISLNHAARSSLLHIGRDAGIPFELIYEELVKNSSLGEVETFVRDHLDAELARAKAIYPANSDELQHAMDVDDKARQQMADVLDKLQKLRAEGYAPLMRFGDWHLTVLDDNGDTVLHERFESERQRNRAHTALINSGTVPDNFSIVTGRDNPKEYQLYQKGVNAEAIALFAKEAGIPLNDHQQAYYKLATSNHSALRRLIHRKGIPGFSDNLPRVLASFVMSSARHSANTLFGSSTSGPLQEALAKMRNGDENWQLKAQEMVQYADDPKEEPLSMKIRQLLFLKNMGGSVAFGVVNLMQPLQQTMPFLAREHGAKAVPLILQGIGRAMSFKIPAEFQQEYDRARREGHLDPASAWSLQGLERGSGGIANSYWGVMNHALGAVAEVTETVNRRATLFAALEGAKSMTQQQLDRYGSAYNYAIQAIQETQGVMNKGNRPKWARGTAGSLLMVYKQFGIAYVEQLIRSIKNPMWRGQRDKWRRSMWMMLMMLWALAGSVGLPFAQNIADTVKGTLSAAGHPVQLDREFEKLVGNEAADFILNGAWNYANLGVDLQGRTSMGSLIPGTQLLDPSITDQSKQRAIAGFGGAAGGMVSDILDAFKNSFEGKPVEATINLAPRSIGSMIKAGQMYATGKFTDSRGRLISDNVTMADVLTKALDGQPARLADIQRSRGMESQADALQASQRRKFKARIVEAVENKDKEALREALADLDQWNKTRKEYPVKITRSEIKQALKKRQQDWTQRSPVRPETLKRMADAM